MSLPEETRHRLSLWCAARVPAQDRAHRQIGYTARGDSVTITERRAPLYPELDMAWTTHPLVQLRRVPARSPGSAPRPWLLYRWNAGAEQWVRGDVADEDPVALLEHLVQAPA